MPHRADKTTHTATTMNSQHPQLHFDAATAPPPVQDPSSAAALMEPLAISPRTAALNGGSSSGDAGGSSSSTGWTSSLPPPMPRGAGSRGRHQMDDEEDQLMQPGATSSAAAVGGQQRRKRARHGVKIKRNRKITSCLACRERKQKCDRTHPVCEKCIEDGRQCIYVDNESPIVDEDGEEPIAGPSSIREGCDEGGSGQSACRRTSSESAAAFQRRREGVRKSYMLSRCRDTPFHDRVKAARAAAVSEVLLLGSPNNTADLPCNVSLVLPTSQEAQPLLDIFKTDVESICNIVLIDLNRARIGSFLDWWHGKPDTLPPEADSPLAPLVLVILALALQAQRARMAMDNFSSNTKTAYDRTKASHHVSLHEFVSPERFLLETAGRCINALQITCPSSWATTYSAPLDVIRAETLRALWHLGECHLQFANSCFTVALRLAYAAGLHRDPTHFQGSPMSAFEMQARRSAWWNIATLEVFHSFRVGQPTSLTLSSIDTKMPTDFQVIADQYELTRTEGSKPNKIAHDALIARFSLARLMIEKSASVFGVTEESAVHKLRDVNEIAERWVAGLPADLINHMNAVDTTPSLQWVDQGSKWQSVGVQLNHLQLCMSAHRLDENQIKAELAGTPLSQHSSKFHICLDAARRSIDICFKAIAGRPAAPCLVLNVISYYAFNAGCMLAIQSVSSMPLPEIVLPVLDQTLAVLDQLGNNDGLFNIAEQAQRYAKTIRELRKKSPPPPEGHPPHSHGRTSAFQGANQQRYELPPPSSGRTAHTEAKAIPVPGQEKGSNGHPLPIQTQGLHPSVSPDIPRCTASGPSWSPTDPPTSSPLDTLAPGVAGAGGAPQHQGGSHAHASHQQPISSTASSTSDSRPRSNPGVQSPASMSSSSCSSSTATYHRDLFARQTDINSMVERTMPNNNISHLSFLTSLFSPNQPGMHSRAADAGMAPLPQGAYPPPAHAAPSTSSNGSTSSPLQPANSSTGDWSSAASDAGRHHPSNGGMTDRKPFDTVGPHAFQPIGGAHQVSGGMPQPHHQHHQPQNHHRVPSAPQYSPHHESYQPHPHSDPTHRQMSYGHPNQPHGNGSMPPPSRPHAQHGISSSWPGPAYTNGEAQGDPSSSSFAGLPASTGLGVGLSGGGGAGSGGHSSVASGVPPHGAIPSSAPNGAMVDPRAWESYINTILQSAE
ncbi:hypothetical protein BDZ90DRAFT_146225 [Jaminaea rosea]|uniref:Zn(2)-C6 fungal-type domain-containing protein n=1 Tax=Jaminaea rosea TaxID=1569628 RepID=A0A316USS0_9BASI|nr:hypothetical protein BDZ90DRAFT_146225 [Jaminaea rosea]PWN28349.1 hypothetical protein BDZ90DRAFT_146225 [Jaminaea rosea]